MKFTSIFAIIALTSASQLKNGPATMEDGGRSSQVVYGGDTDEMNVPSIDDFEKDDKEKKAADKDSINYDSDKLVDEDSFPDDNEEYNDDGAPLEVTSKMDEIADMRPKVGDMERRLNMMRKVQPELQDAIKVLKMVTDTSNMKEGGAR